jgi:hypothetical protein
MFGELLQAHIAMQIHKSVKPPFLLCEMSMAGELECINKYFVILWAFSLSKAFR